MISNQWLSSPPAPVGRIRPLLALLFFLLSSGAISPWFFSGSSDLDKSLVNIRVTTQKWSHYRPWRKEQDRQRETNGIYIGQGRVITTADMVLHHTYIELEKQSTTDRFPARVVYIDTPSNLALLKAEDAAFARDLVPMKIGRRFLKNKTALRLARLTDNKTLYETSGRLVETVSYNYPYALHSLSAYKVSTGIINGGWSEVLLEEDGDDNTMVGLTMYYFEKKNVAIAIPAPVLRLFVKMAEKKMAGLPFHGISAISLRNPFLRKFLGADATGGGVYITGIMRDSSADGVLRPGDILTEINGQPVAYSGLIDDELGNRLDFTRLFLFRGDEGLLPGQKVAVRLRRGGKTKNLSIRLRPYPNSRLRVPDSFYPQKAPNFIIVGGFVFTELSREYLHEWGNDWRKNASRRLTFLLDHFAFRAHQAGFDPKETSTGRGPGKTDWASKNRIVVLSHVLADEINQGIGGFRDGVLLKVNEKNVDSVADIARALKKAGNKTGNISFELSGGYRIYLDKSRLKQANQRIRKNYGINKLRRIQPLSGGTTGN